MGDVIVTWPKGRPLSSYLQELSRAAAQDQLINFRTPSQPRKVAPGDRCYMVYDGAIRGFNRVVEVTYRAWGEVSRVESDPLAGWWPGGWYIVRWPYWYEIEPISMKGFRGFKYWPEDWATPTVLEGGLVS